MRSTSILLALVLLVGCGGSDDEATETDAVQTGPVQPEVTDPEPERRTDIDTTPEEIDPLVALEQQVGSTDSMVRAEAAVKLGEVAPDRRQEAAVLLVPLLEDEDEEVRQVAAQAYGNLEGADYEPLRTRATREEEPTVKKAVLEAAFNLAGADSIKLMLSVAADDYEEEFVRSFAIDALGRLRATEARSYLEEACEDISGVIRLQAVIALGRLGGEQSIDVLGERVQDNSPTVQVEAVRALRGIGKRRVVRHLIRGFDVEDVELAHELNAALEEITKEKKGYDPALTLEGNKKAIEAWLSWWEANKSFY